MVEDSSGVLVQKESGIYGFIDRAFQEYMASVHIRRKDYLLNSLVGWTKLGGMRLRDCIQLKRTQVPLWKDVCCRFAPMLVHCCLPPIVRQKHWNYKKVCVIACGR